jgi:class 3 adenylate cyclase
VAALHYRDGQDRERSYVLEGERPVTIGRGLDADVCLAWDPSVSSVHAEAVPLGAHWLIGDDGVSRNGTFVNGERLKGRRRLRDGDVVRVGHTTLAFRDAGEERTAATTITDVHSASGTVTMLFTDLAGSTELIARLGDEAGDRVLREHFALLRSAADEHGGREVKTLGDGIMVAFASALGAVACAIDMQQRIASGQRLDTPALGLRIGLNAGEVISVGDDFFGMPVVVAKRLCDSAAPGQALASEVVRSLVGSRDEDRFVPIGPVALKGLSDPVVAFELDWRKLASRPGETAGTSTQR